MKITWSKKNLILAFAASGLWAFFIFRYVDLLYTKARIELELTQTVRQVGFLDAQLKDEKGKVEGLSQEKSALKQELLDSQAKAERLSSQKLEAEGHVFSLIGEIQGWERKVDGVLEEKAKIEENLKALEEKNSLMEAKLNSIPELKKEIRNLKRKRKVPDLVLKFELKELPRPTEQIEEKARVPSSEKIFALPDEEGNSGFMVKDGESTYRKRLWPEEAKPRPSGRRLKIEVRPEL